MLSFAFVVLAADVVHLFLACISTWPLDLVDRDSRFMVILLLDYKLMGWSLVQRRLLWISSKSGSRTA